MAPRPHWKGYLKLSLVSCPISLYPAVSAEQKVSFRQVNRDTGNRLRQQLVDTVTGEVVESHNKGRGYEVGENRFLMVPDEELEAAEREARTRPFTPPVAPDTPSVEPPARPALKLVEPGKRRAASVAAPEPGPAPAPAPRPIIENTHTIELDRFIAREEIDPRYYLAPYYIAPRDQVGEEAFAVIRDAMGHKGMVGMGRVVLANRERPILIEPRGLGLRAFTLRYAHEVRPETDYFADIPPLQLPEDLVQITEYILESKRERFDATYLEDRYRTVLVEKLKEKRAKEVPAKASSAAASARNVINLMDALKASLATQKPPAASKTRRVAAKSVASTANASAKGVRKPRST